MSVRARVYVVYVARLGTPILVSLQDADPLVRWNLYVSIRSRFTPPARPWEALLPSGRLYAITGS